MMVWRTRGCWLGLALLCVGGWTAAAIDIGDFPGGIGSTYNRVNVLTDISFEDSSIDDRQETMFFTGVSSEDAWGLFTGYFYFFAMPSHLDSDTWREWAAKPNTKKLLAQIIATRMPKDCAARSTDKQKFACWLNKAFKAKQIRLGYGEFAVRNGKNVYLDLDAPTKFPE